MKLVKFRGIYQTQEESDKPYSHKEGDIYDTVYVAINNEYYRFMENPDDGYRSYCEITKVRKEQLPDGCKFNFQDDPIIVYMSKDEDHDHEDYNKAVGAFSGICIFSPIDKEVVGIFGTDSSDDYYPVCKMWMDIPKINKDCIPYTKSAAVLFGDEESE